MVRKTIQELKLTNIYDFMYGFFTTDCNQAYISHLDKIYSGLLSTLRD